MLAPDRTPPNASYHSAQQVTRVETLLQNKMFQEAADGASQVLDTLPPHDPTNTSKASKLRARCAVVLAQAYFELRNSNSACDVVEQAFGGVSTAPPDYVLLHIRLLSALGRHSEACDAVIELIVANPPEVVPANAVTDVVAYVVKRGLLPARRFDDAVFFIDAVEARLSARSPSSSRNASGPMPSWHVRLAHSIQTARARESGIPHPMTRGVHIPSSSRHAPRTARDTGRSVHAAAADAADDRGTTRSSSRVRDLSALRNDTPAAVPRTRSASAHGMHPPSGARNEAAGLPTNARRRHVRITGGSEAPCPDGPQGAGGGTDRSSVVSRWAPTRPTRGDGVSDGRGGAPRDESERAGGDGTSRPLGLVAAVAVGVATGVLGFGAFLALRAIAGSLLKGLPSVGYVVTTTADTGRSLVRALLRLLAVVARVLTRISGGNPTHRVTQ